MSRLLLKLSLLLFLFSPLVAWASGPIFECTIIAVEGSSNIEVLITQYGVPYLSVPIPENPNCDDSDKAFELILQYCTLDEYLDALLEFGGFSCDSNSGR